MWEKRVTQQRMETKSHKESAETQTLAVPLLQAQESVIPLTSPEITSLSVQPRVPVGLYQLKDYI